MLYIENGTYLGIHGLEFRKSDATLQADKLTVVTRDHIIITAAIWNRALGCWLRRSCCRRVGRGGSWSCDHRGGHTVLAPRWARTDVLVAGEVVTETHNVGIPRHELGKRDISSRSSRILLNQASTGFSKRNIVHCAIRGHTG